MSKTIRILYIHTMMFHRRCWQQATDKLIDLGVEVIFVSQQQALEQLEAASWEILVAELSPGQDDYQEIIARADKVAHRLSLSPELPTDFTTYTNEARATFAEFSKAMSAHNYAGALISLAREAGFIIDALSLKKVKTTGIWHPEAAGNFTTPTDYLAWRTKNKLPTSSLVAVLFYYGQLVEDNMAEICLLVRRLEKMGFCPLPVFSPGVEEGESQPAWFSMICEEDNLDGLINCMSGRLFKTREEAKLLEKLDVPVLQTLRSHSQTPLQWLEDPVGLPTMTVVFSQSYPEMFGAIQPTMVAGTLQEQDKEDRGTRTFLPIPERINCLCNRLKRQAKLRLLTNKDKRLTIALHNNPCKGVEASIGMAVGLDTFTSLGRLIKALAQAGYDTGDAPFDGNEILAEIERRKAMAEFRWTTIDEIVDKGGSLHMMGRDEYGNWFDKLDGIVQDKVNEDWGLFPGQGMVWQEDGEDVLVITGLSYGNIQIIVQPKRGCYGAKCNGEVCRILHDPNLAPPHHWLATYKFIQDSSDAVIHFGTEGALEYLPGKQNGLSDRCFPEVSIGDLPNFYIYVMDAVGEGLIAKRRGQAILVDHLGPIYSPTILNEEMVQLEELLNQYSQAQQSNDKTRMRVLHETMMPLLSLLDLGLSDENSELTSSLDLARRSLANQRCSLSPESLHVLGQIPDNAETGRLLATMLRKSPDELPDTAEIAESHGNAALVLSEIISKSPEDIKPKQRKLHQYCRQVADGLADCHLEIVQLLHGLNGGYIPAGLAGSLASGQIEALPTGRNFFSKDISRLPTKAAWQVGQAMAVALLEKYLGEEACFPEQVGISIWSADAFKSDGELFCQILCLMGIRPKWDRQGKSVGIEVIPLDELKLTWQDKEIARPRVDVTIETSGIMRDMVPHFCDLLDQAVVLASGLDESFADNFIRKHTEEQMTELRSQTASDLSEAQIRRMATYRVFSSPPGTYGLGVGLALDASAWTTDKDLAEVYINWGGHAYGSGQEAVVARDLLAKQLGRLDIAYMKQTSEEYDILDCSCYAVSQGSMATATRALSGGNAKLYWTEAGAGAELSDTKEQLIHSAQTRLLNRAWINGMKKHGYQGAMAVSSRVNNLFKWSATSHAVPKTLFDQVVATYIQNQENNEWLTLENPYAMEEITRRLLEAASRGLWQADEEMLTAVQNAALAIEGEMEERMGDVREEFQGSKVDVLGVDDVDKWQMEWRIAK
jgi:cobaltochelatase CobN